MKLEKHLPDKHKEILGDYLKHLEREFEYIPFIFSTSFIEILSQFKEIFLVTEDKKIINLGYENKIKNHFGFLFEAPKKDYGFLKNARTIATIWVPKQKKENIECKEFIDFDEIIIDTKSSLDLSKTEFVKLRKKIRKLKRDYPELTFEEFDKDKISKKDLQKFYSKWEEITKSRKSPYMFLYENYVKYIYDEKNILNGIVAKYKNEIVGISFFLISPQKKQAIGLSCNGFHTIKGLNEFLAYERYKLLWKKYKINFVNVGPCGPGEVTSIKEKFNAIREDFGIAILKGKDLENKYFWYNDALDPDDFNQGQYDEVEEEK